MLIDEVLKEIFKVSELKHKLQKEISQNSIVSADTLKKLKNANLKLRILRLTLENINNRARISQEKNQVSPSLLYEDYYSDLSLEQLREELKSGYQFMQEIEEEERGWVWNELKKIKALIDAKSVKK